VSVLAHHHELEVPPDLQIASAGDVVVLHGDAARRLVISIHPVTALGAERWIRSTLVDAPIVETRYESWSAGPNRCRRVTITQPALRRVVVFVEPRDGSDRWLPLVLASSDDRHDRVFETLVASARDTRSHPFAMWLD